MKENEKLLQKKEEKMVIKICKNFVQYIVQKPVYYISFNKKYF